MRNPGPSKKDLRWRFRNRNDVSKSGKSTEALLFAVFLIFVAVFGALSFCKPWLPPLASNRVSIDQLFHVTLIITGVVFVFVQATTGFFIWRFSKENNDRALYHPHNRRLEITWTIVTAIFLFGLAGWSFSEWKNTMLKPPPADAITVEAIGQQFAWSFRYPTRDGIFAHVDPHLISYKNPLGLDPKDENSKDNPMTKELYLPVNRPVVVRIRALDVIHSFFLPNFRVKQDAVPGMTIETSFTPTKIGDFEIACAQLCGAGHYTMRSVLHVLSDEDYRKKIEELRKEQG